MFACGAAPARGFGATIGVIVVGFGKRGFVLIVPPVEVMLTLSVALMPPAPSMTNVHVGPALTAVTVKVAPLCEIVA